MSPVWSRAPSIFQQALGCRALVPFLDRCANPRGRAGRGSSHLPCWCASCSAGLGQLRWQQPACSTMGGVWGRGMSGRGRWEKKHLLLGWEPPRWCLNKGLIMSPTCPGNVGARQGRGGGLLERMVPKGGTGGAGCCFGGLFAVISPSKANTSPKHKPRGGCTEMERGPASNLPPKGFLLTLARLLGLIYLYNTGSSPRVSQGPQGQSWWGGKPWGGEGG